MEDLRPDRGDRVGTETVCPNTSTVLVKVVNKHRFKWRSRVETLYLGVRVEHGSSPGRYRSFFITQNRQGSGHYRSFLLFELDVLTNLMLSYRFHSARHRETFLREPLEVHPWTLYWNHKLTKDEEGGALKDHNPKGEGVLTRQGRSLCLWSSVSTIH